MLSKTDIITVRHFREARIPDEAPAPRLIPDRDIQTPRILHHVSVAAEGEAEGQHIEVSTVPDAFSDDLEGAVILPPIVIIHEQDPAAGCFIQPLVPGLSAVVPVNLKNLIGIFHCNVHCFVSAIITDHNQLVIRERLPPD